MYDISMYGTDKKNLTRKERMKRRARKMIKAGLKEDECYCCSLEGSPTTACIIIAGIVFLIIFCLIVFAVMSAGFDFEATFAEPGVQRRYYYLNVLPRGRHIEQYLVISRIVDIIQLFNGMHLRLFDKTIGPLDWLEITGLNSRSEMQRIRTSYCGSKAVVFRSIKQQQNFKTGIRLFAFTEQWDLDDQQT
uniref:Uncharacterized protein n=1 Tax=Setaria digitata TaxID=48799 RepID=A0A915Q1N2_9BILA